MKDSKLDTLLRIHTGRRKEEKMIKKTDGGVTAAKGFEAIGIAAGIKKERKTWH